MTMERIAYSCAKCANPTYTAEEVRTAGKYSRFFDVQNKKFTAVTCDNCGYTDFYRADGGRAGNILDFFTS